MKKNRNQTIKTFIKAVFNCIGTLNFINMDWNDKTVIFKMIVVSVIAGVAALIKITPDEAIDRQTKDKEEQ